ncbi:hypothetical protein [Vibrio fluvialis]|uniref:hypothetical protein n=1 Tax=Vibrio fluvialis TaxID=676 RepID=UPI0023A92E4D|nr:hypothetical protein [Vibrio fluvialis]MDE5179189.1 hypothetical protein [Vibrio fluvialis]
MDSIFSIENTIALFSMLIACVALYFSKSSADASLKSAEIASAAFLAAHQSSFRGSAKLVSVSGQNLKAKIELTHHGKEAFLAERLWFSGRGLSGTSDSGYSIASDNKIVSSTSIKGGETRTFDVNFIVGVGKLKEIVLFVHIDGIDSLHQDRQHYVPCKVTGLRDLY